MIWKMWAEMFIITHSLKCWETGPLEITSKYGIKIYFLRDDTGLFCLCYHGDKLGFLFDNLNH